MSPLESSALTQIHGKAFSIKSRFNDVLKQSETAYQSISHANLILDANHYNIASYRADNKKLKVILPGEVRA